MSKATRRPHNKSRTGCRRCKERRVKCSEEKPTCARCRRNGTSCVYPIALSAPSHPTASPVGGGGSVCVSDAAPAGRGAATAGGGFDVSDLVLMHHWTVHTSVSTFHAPWARHLWQVVVPGIAAHHAFLMHDILALAALHMRHAHVHRPRDAAHLLVRATAHHNAAIGGFREAMARIDAQNGDALFAAAIINMFYVFALPQADGAGRPDETALSAVLGVEWIRMVRGCGAVLQPVYEHVSSGPLRRLLEIGDWCAWDPAASPTSPGDEDDDGDDDRLAGARDAWDPADPHAGVYDETRYRLRQTLRWMDEHAASDSTIYWAGPFVCLHLVPERYLDLLWQRQPAALVLFAFFGALVHRLDGFWWAQGWGRKIVGAIHGYLGPYWEPHLRWALVEVGLGNALP